MAKLTLRLGENQGTKRRQSCLAGRLEQRGADMVFELFRIIDTAEGVRPKAVAAAARLP